MEKLISKETESDLTKLGVYQIIGGAIGIVILLWVIFKTPLMSGLTVLLFLLILLFFTYSIYCGTLCIKTRKQALRHSLINQMLQFIGFAMTGFAFKYVAGVYFAIGLDLTDSININFGAGVSKFDFNFNNERDRLEVDFNLVALAFIIWIDKLMKQVKEDAEIRQASSIGEN